MGLGKTIQSITFLDHIYKYGIRGPFLIIVPLSTLGNWQREFEAWTDLNVVVYHGSSASRYMLQEYEMYYKDEKVHSLNISCPFCCCFCLEFDLSCQQKCYLGKRVKYCHIVQELSVVCSTWRRDVNEETS